MGCGISGAIPIDFNLKKKNFAGKDKTIMELNLAEGFFDFYDESEEEKDILSYCIKSDLLLPNFKDFYFGFHALIDNKYALKNTEAFNDNYDAIVKQNDMDAFLDYFYEKKYEVPFCDSGGFSTNMRCGTVLLFYRGSYKAILEEYSTFYHMERLLVKAFDNPLAKVVKFGLFG
jgi:hypothetical protein